MELYKFNDVDNVSPFEGGQPFEAYDSARWTERSQEAGEVEISAKLSSGLRELLPPGSRISHIDTDCIMFIENHNIIESSEEDPTITITGRDLKSILERRIVGANLGWNNPAPPMEEYTTGSVQQKIQIETLINDHILASEVADAEDELPYLQAIAVGTSPTGVVQVIKRQVLYDAVMDLLKQYDLSLLPSRSGDEGLLIVQDGADRSDEVIFTWSIGDIDDAEYLFSDKSLKNVAYVVGKWVEEFVYTGANKWDRRVMLVDGSDLDQNFSAAPTGGDLTTVRSKMYTRGEQALLSQIETNLVQVTVSNNARYKYGTDFGLGDIVSLSGSYGVLEPRRVTEYTLIQDENGESGHPTLSALIS